MAPAKIGLLPLWLKLYDDSAPEARPRIEGFVRAIAGEFERRGVTAVAASVCRLAKEFAAAVKRFEKEEVDAIVTLHLAYSPSLEASEVLARTRLPISRRALLSSRVSGFHDSSRRTSLRSSGASPGTRSSCSTDSCSRSPVPTPSRSSARGTGFPRSWNVLTF